MALREKWYNYTFVQFELIKCSKNRESSFLPDVEKGHPLYGIPVRNINAGKVDFLRSNFQRWDFLQKSYNFYISVARTEGLPCFSYRPDARKRESKLLNETFENYLVGYDCVLDFDGKGFPNAGGPAYNDLMEAMRFLDKYQIQYNVNFSGRKGFHLWINDFPGSKEPIKKIEEIKNFSERFAEILNLNTIDRGIYDARRLIKCPYSLVEQNVVLPLTKKQLKTWHPNHVQIYDVIRNVHIKNRGLCTYN